MLKFFLIILTLVKVDQKDFIQGTSAMVFCSRGERLSSTLNKTKKVEIYSQEAGYSWVSVDGKFLRGSIRVREILAKLTQQNCC